MKKLADILNLQAFLHVVNEKNYSRIEKKLDLNRLNPTFHC